MNLLDPKDHEFFMAAALREAMIAFEHDEVPVGAVIAHEKKIIARAHNQVEMLNDATAHAEMIAITQASEYLNDWRLDKCTLYVTLECCPMCVGAIMQSRIKKVCYGAPDFRMGSFRSLVDLPSELKWDHTIEVIGDICADESSQLLKQFFAKARKNENKK